MEGKKCCKSSFVMTLLNFIAPLMKSFFVFQHCLGNGTFDLHEGKYFSKVKVNSN